MKDRQLIIIGASGHGKVVADIARLNGYKKIIALDDADMSDQWRGMTVAGRTSCIDSYEGDVFVSIGNATIRRKLMELYSYREFVTLIHPSAVIAEDVRIGIGSVIMAGAIINSGTTVGVGCIINTASSIDHDCQIGDYVHVAVGSHLCGTVTVGYNTWIGAGSIVSNNLSICNDCMIGAGAVVVNDIKRPGTYIGVPAREK